MSTQVRRCKSKDETQKSKGGIRGAVVFLVGKCDWECLSVLLTVLLSQSGIISQTPTAIQTSSLLIRFPTLLRVNRGRCWQCAQDELGPRRRRTQLTQLWVNCCWKQGSPAPVFISLPPPTAVEIVFFLPFFLYFFPSYCWGGLRVPRATWLLSSTGR